MKRKVILTLITAFAMLMSTAYAETNTPAWSQKNNEVAIEFAESETYNTVLITDESNNIFYIGQNQDGYTSTQTFLIKNDPDDGTYTLRAGRFGFAPLSAEFSILTYYNVKVKIPDHISDMVLTKKGGTPIGEPITGRPDEEGNIVFVVSKGEYTIKATCESGYHLKNEETEITIDVKKDATEFEPAIETEADPVYTVSGKADAHIQKVELKNDESTAVGTGGDVNGPDYSFTISGVPAGEYTVRITTDADYALDTMKLGDADVSDSKITVSGDINNLNITSKATKTYTVTGTVDGGVKSVTLTNSTAEFEGAIVDTTVTFSNVVAGTYNVVIEYNNEYEIEGSEPGQVTITGEEGSIFSIATKLKTYTVSGTVDSGVKSVKLKKDGAEITGAIEGTTVTFSDVTAGTYNVMIEYNEEYEIDGTAPGPYTVNSNASDIFNIKTKAIRYTVTVTLGENVVGAVLMDGNESPVQGTKENSTVTFSVPAGTYTVSATAAEGYEIDTYTPGSSVTVNKSSASAAVSVTAKKQVVPTYEVSGTVDEGVGSLIIKQGGTTVTTITQFEDNKFSYNLKSGEYTIKVVPKEDYEIDGDTDETSFTVGNQAITVTIAKTKKKQTPPPPPTGPRTETERSEGKDDDGNDTIILTAKLKEVARFNSIIAAAYSRDGALISVQRIKIGDGEDEIKFEFDKNVEIDRFRILVWNSMTYMKPVTNGEDVPNTP